MASAQSLEGKKTTHRIREVIFKLVSDTCMGLRFGKAKLYLKSTLSVAVKHDDGYFMVCASFSCASFGPEIALHDHRTAWHEYKSHFTRSDISHGADIVLS